MRIPPALKVLILLVVVLFQLTACKDKKPSEAAVSPIQETVTVTPAKVAETAKPIEPLETAKPIEPLPPTSEQVISTFRVKVIIGALSPKFYTAAMLHQDETSMLRLGTKGRCVLAVLKGITEAQLKSPETRILLVRNTPNESAEGYATKSYIGTLAQYDPASSLAVLAYTDRLDASVDVGYKIDRSGKLPASANSLRAITRPLVSAPSTKSGATPALGNRPVGFPSHTMPSRRPAETVEMELYSTPSKTAALKPESKNGSDVSQNPILVSNPAILHGLVSENEDGTSEVVSLQNFKLQIDLPHYEPKAIALGRLRPNSIDFAIATEPPVPEGKQPLGFVADLQPPGSSPNLAEFKQPRASVEKTYGLFTPLSRIHGTSMQSGNIRIPQQDGIHSFVVHLGCLATPGQNSVISYSRPFLIRVEKSGEAIKTSVQNLDLLPDPRIPPPGSVSDFPLESPIQNIQEIAEGKEILFHLQGPPYWKRFSVVKRTWLPLPPGNLANCDLTGNRQALFLLDKGGSEVRKFDLGDLRLLRSAKLPTGARYFAIRTGPLTERAPVHVLKEDGALIKHCVI